MKRNNRIISLLTAAAITAQLCPFNVSSEMIESGDWLYNTYYDNGMIATDLIYTGASDEIFVPEELDGCRVTGVLLAAIDWYDDYYRNVEELTIHLPESAYIEDMNNIYDCFCSRLEKITIDYEIGEDIVYSADDPEFGMIENENPADVWDYKILDKLDGVYDGPCVDLLQYKGDMKDLVVPLKIAGYPVARISGQILKGKEVYCISLPLCVENRIEDAAEEEEYYNNYSHDYISYYDYKMANPKDYGLVWPEIQLADGCLDSDHDLIVTYVPYVYTAHYSEAQDGTPRFRKEKYEKSFSKHIDYLKIDGKSEKDYKWVIAAINHYNSMSEEPDMVKIPAYIAGHPVVSIQPWTDDDLRSEDLIDLELPDTIDVLQPWALYGLKLRSVKIPKNVKILTQGAIGNGIGLEEIKGIENVPFVSDELFPVVRDYFGNVKEYPQLKLEAVVPAEHLVHFNYDVSDIYNAFVVTDTKTGYSYRINVNRSDNSISVALIYVPDITDELPKEFNGYTLKYDLSSEFPKGARIVIPEDKKVFSKDDMVFLKNGMNSADVSNNDQTMTYEELLEKYYNEQSKYTSDITIRSTDLRLESGAFRQARPKVLEFPGSAYLSAECLEGVDTLEKLIFSGDNPTIIFEDRALRTNKGISEVVFPEKCSDVQIGENAFLGCGVKNLIIPKGTSVISSNAFGNSNRMNYLTINGSPVLRENAFANCNNLKEVTINGDPQIEANAFSRCSGITNINVDLTKKINGAAFNGCENLTSINRESVFESDGSLKKKFEDFVLNNFRETDNCGIVNKYTSYMVEKTVRETVTDDMTDMEKIKALHDKLCDMVSYDHDDVDAMKNHTDLSVFINDTSVCEGYARAYNLMLHEAGIKSCYVCNEDHGWVIVEFGGHAFHVDPTWDDGDTVNYNWFLKSDMEICEKDSHEVWKMIIPSALHRFQLFSMPKCTERIGDVNNDGIVDGRDASIILKAYAVASVGDDTDVDVVLADYDYNGRIDAADASGVLDYYAKSSVG